MAPKLQLALDVTETQTALDVLEQVASDVDVIEAGTVLCLSQGLGAVTKLREAYPKHPLVADIRIARAGRKFADMAFGAGASIVTVVGESAPDVVEGAIASATSHGGQVEVELGHDWSDADVRRWVGLGVSNIIVHRPLGLSEADDHGTRESLRRLRDLDLGGTAVSLAGGLSAEGLHHFAGLPVDVIVVGSNVVGAADPAAALRAMRQSAEAIFGGAS